MRPSIALAGLAAIAVAAPARAQDAYARPPDPDGPPIAASPWREPPPDEPGPYPYADDDTLWRRRELSVFRLHVGGAGKPDTDSITPGLLSALDIGRGPAGFRLTAVWLRVGSEQGLAQYTGELTLDFGGRRSWRPVLGAGAGVVRTYRVDDQGNRVGGGSTLGIGAMRAAIEYKLPVEEADARAGLSRIGAQPAARGDGAPDAKPWLVVAATVGVGF
jgi:hypothetical protein